MSESKLTGSGRDPDHILIDFGSSHDFARILGIDGRLLLLTRHGRTQLEIADIATGRALADHIRAHLAAATDLHLAASSIIAALLRAIGAALCAPEAGGEASQSQA